VHQSLLSGRRAGLAAPWRDGEQIPLRTSRSSDGGVRAYLGPGFRVEISRCDGKWCDVTAIARLDGRSANYSGYLPQDELWGVYEGEAFD